MCAVPTSAADPAWQGTDATWERLQIEAAKADAAGDHGPAADGWAAALRLARGMFEPDDPRLATSLVNRALVLRRRGDGAAERLLEEALGILAAAPVWLERQTFRPRSRSTVFHLRLEAKHPGAYEANLRKRARALLQGARDDVAALNAGAAGAPPGPGALRALRNAPPDAMRKVLATVHLLAAPRPDEAAQAPPQDGS